MMGRSRLILCFFHGTFRCLPSGKSAGITVLHLRAVTMLADEKVQHVIPTLVTCFGNGFRLRGMPPYLSRRPQTRKTGHEKLNSFGFTGNCINPRHLSFWDFALEQHLHSPLSARVNDERRRSIAPGS